MLKPEELKFPPVVWTDHESGGAGGTLCGYTVRIEAWGRDEPMWTIVIGDHRYGYERGGRDGERTLDEIKAIAEGDLHDSLRRRYDSSLRIVTDFNRVFGG